MTRSSQDLCLADFSKQEILGLFDRADQFDGSTSGRFNASAAGVAGAEAGAAGAEAATAPHRLSDESWHVLKSLHQLRHEGIAIEELTVAWIGPATSHLHAWLEAASILGFSLRMAVPDGYEPDAGLFLACEGRAPGRLVRCRDEAGARTGASVTFTPSSPIVSSGEEVDTTGLSSALDDFFQGRNRERIDFRALIDAIPPTAG